MQSPEQTEPGATETPVQPTQAPKRTRKHQQVAPVVGPSDVPAAPQAAGGGDAVQAEPSVVRFVIDHTFGYVAGGGKHEIVRAGTVLVLGKDDELITRLHRLGAAIHQE
jgi:hypothetical protein